MINQEHLAKIAAIQAAKDEAARLERLANEEKARQRKQYGIVVFRFALRGFLGIETPDLAEDQYQVGDILYMLRDVQAYNNGVNVRISAQHVRTDLGPTNQLLSFRWMVAKDDTTSRPMKSVPIEPEEWVADLEQHWDEVQRAIRLPDQFAAQIQEMITRRVKRTISLFAAYFDWEEQKRENDERQRQREEQERQWREEEERNQREAEQRRQSLAHLDNESKQALNWLTALIDDLKSGQPLDTKQQHLLATAKFVIAVDTYTPEEY